MWGSAFLMTKVALESLPPSLVVAGRMVVASGVLLALGAVWLRRLPGGRRTWMFFVLIAFFGNALPFSLISRPPAIRCRYRGYDAARHGYPAPSL